MRKIPICEPILNQGNEVKYLNQCIKSNWVSSDGYFVRKFEEEFAKWSGNKYAVAICNGTAALESAIWSLDIKDEYIGVPIDTIISCALAVLRTNNIVFFYSLNRGRFITKFPIIRCHLFGHFDNSTSINYEIDDCSQYWKPFKVRDVACYSLYANKLITSGEGGIVVTNRKTVYDRLRSYRDLCHSKERFIHNDLGYNFRMSNLQAAVALAQLEQIDKFVAKKQKIRDWYKKYIQGCHFLAYVEVPWMFLIETLPTVEKIIPKLAKLGIETRRYFYPLHRQPCFREKYRNFKFPKEFWDWKHKMYLPSGLNLTEREVKYICQSLKNTLNTIG